MKLPMMHVRTLIFAALAMVQLTAPAFARTDYVQDGAHLFKTETVRKLDSEIDAFHAQTGKEIVVVTTPSLDGTTARDAVEKTFSEQQVNGVLFYFAKKERIDEVVGDRASKAFFPAGSFQTIHNAMRGYLRSGDPDTAIDTGVSLVLNDYRGHLRSTGASGPVEHRNTQSMGGFGLIITIVLLVVGFLVIRGIIRAMTGPRAMPPGYGGPGYGAPPMGGPGYGGYPPMGGGMGMGGMGGGGGGFFSGLLGGLGGAFLGNELFGRRDNNFGGGFNQGNMGGGLGGNDFQGQSNDAAGWQNDAGQADMSDMGGGSYGDSGGGDSGGGFGGGGDTGGGDGGW